MERQRRVRKLNNGEKKNKPRKPRAQPANLNFDQAMLLENEPQQQVQQIEQPQNAKLTTALLQQGDWFSSIIYNRVKAVDQYYLSVENQYGNSYQIEKSIAENEGFSASQSNAQKKVTRTELCELLENAGDAVFTINFVTKATDEKAKQLLATLKPEDLLNAEVLRQTAKNIIKGEETTIVGYLRNREPKMGRSSIVDLNAPRPNNIRLVDHRTINWMIFKGIKYVAK